MKFKIETARMAKFNLVEFRPRLMELYKNNNKALFITVSPNPEKKHEVVREVKMRKSKLKIQYRFMTHEEQYEYLNSYIDEVYVRLMEHTDWLYIAYEVNENNDMHAHMILYSDSIKTDYDVKALRKSVVSHPYTIYNMPKSKRDYMNNIVYLDEDKIDHIIEYFNKDMSIKINYPDNYIEK